MKVARHSKISQPVHVEENNSLDLDFFPPLPSVVPAKYCHTGNTSLISAELLASAAGHTRAAICLSSNLNVAVCESPNFGIGTLRAV